MAKVEASAKDAEKQTGISAVMSAVNSDIDKENRPQEADSHADSGLESGFAGTTDHATDAESEATADESMDQSKADPDKGVDASNMSANHGANSFLDSFGLMASANPMANSDQTVMDTVVFQSRNVAKEKKKRTTLSQKAGLTFPVRRIHNQLKKGRYARKIQTGKSDLHIPDLT